MPDFSADLALFAHSGSDFVSDSGEVISINKLIQIRSLQLMTSERKMGVSQANVTNH